MDGTATGGFEPRLQPGLGPETSEKLQLGSGMDGYNMGTGGMDDYVELFQLTQTFGKGCASGSSELRLSSAPPCDQTVCNAVGVMATKMVGQVQSMTSASCHDGSGQSLPLRSPDADFKILPSEAPPMSPAWVRAPSPPTSHHAQISPLASRTMTEASHQHKSQHCATNMQRGDSQCLRVMTQYDVESSSSVHNLMMQQWPQQQQEGSGGPIGSRSTSPTMCLPQQHQQQEHHHHQQPSPCPPSPTSSSSSYSGPASHPLPSLIPSPRACSDDGFMMPRLVNPPPPPQASTRYAPLSQSSFNNNSHNMRAPALPPSYLQLSPSQGPSSSYDTSTQLCPEQPRHRRADSYPNGMEARQQQQQPWYSSGDFTGYRREIMKRIMILIKDRKKNAPPDWLDKLPTIAMRLEMSLLQAASSFDEYISADTLKERLQVIAQQVGQTRPRLDAPPPLSLAPAPALSCLPSPSSTLSAPDMPRSPRDAGASAPWVLHVPLSPPPTQPLSPSTASPSPFLNETGQQPTIDTTNTFTIDTTDPILCTEAFECLDSEYHHYYDSSFMPQQSCSTLDPQLTCPPPFFSHSGPPQAPPQHFSCGPRDPLSGPLPLSFPSPAPCPTSSFSSTRLPVIAMQDVNPLLHDMAPPPPRPLGPSYSCPPMPPTHAPPFVVHTHTINSGAMRFSSSPLPPPPVSIRSQSLDSSMLPPHPQAPQPQAPRSQAKRPRATKQRGRTLTKQQLSEHQQHYQHQMLWMMGQGEQPPSSNANPMNTDMGLMSASQQASKGGKATGAPRQPRAPKARKGAPLQESSVAPPYDQAMQPPFQQQQHRVQEFEHFHYQHDSTTTQQQQQQQQQQATHYYHMNDQQAPPPNGNTYIVHQRGQGGGVDFNQANASNTHHMY